MAEEVENIENTEVESKPQLDESKLSELIKKGLKDSFDELATNQRNNQPQQEVQSTDPWEEVLGPRIRKGTQASDSRSAAAEDKVDFYT